MAKAIVIHRKRPLRLVSGDAQGGVQGNAQAGFSLVELLVAAFILVIGILGLVMLQLIALRADRGTVNMSTAAHIAAQVLDQAEQEGRLSWLNITDSNLIDPSQIGFTFKYITLVSGTPLSEQYNIHGNIVDSESDDPLEQVAFFTVTTNRVAVLSAGGPNTTGNMSDLHVRVTFTDSIEADSGQGNTRTFNLTRRIIHG